MLFQDRHVVVTGGTGALGSAVVGALLEAGATCHVPYIVPAGAARSPHRAHARAKLVGALLAAAPPGDAPSTSPGEPGPSPPRPRARVNLVAAAELPDEAKGARLY